MANEIQATASLKVSKNGIAVGQNFSKFFDMAGDQMLGSPQDIGTSAEAISFAGITGAPKKVLIVNLDDTNYVEVDAANTFDKFPQKLTPGDMVLLSPQTGTIYAKAHTANVLIGIFAAEA